MVLDISTQLNYFFSTFLAGLIVGVLIDVYRIFRLTTPSNKIVASISDILFWILEALVVFVFLIYTNNGDIRYYTFIGIGVGILIYFKLLTKTIRYMLVRIIVFTSKIFSIIKNILLLPFKLIVILYSHISIRFNGIYKVIHKKSLLKKEKVKLKKNKETV